MEQNGNFENVLRLKAYIIKNNYLFGFNDVFPRKMHNI